MLSSVGQLFNISLREWRYAFVVRRSGCFDREYYLNHHPNLRRFWRKFPELHYVISGEVVGHAPNDTFCPNSYLDMHPDVAAYSDAPFLHYIRHGQYEDRQIASASRSPQYFSGKVLAAEEWPCRADFAIIVHIYYPEIWEQIASRLADLDLDFDLIVSLPDNKKLDAVSRSIQAGTFQDAIVVRTPNIGRDIFPFVHLVRSGLLSRYKAVCKLHTKKSPHLANGHIWRDKLVAGLLPENDVQELLDLFLQEQDVSVLVPDQFYYTGETLWGGNRKRAESILQRCDLSSKGKTLHFPAGSMYWCKPDLLEAINRLNLRPNCFEKESGQLDATTAHALERSIGYLTDSIGKQICTVSQLNTDNNTEMMKFSDMSNKAFQLQRANKRIPFDR